MPNKVPKEVTREREAAAWSLRQKGYTHQRIADELKVERSTVTRMLARVDRRVLAQLNRAVELLKVEQTEILRGVLDEAMQAWERSEHPAVAKKVTKTKRPGGDGGGDADDGVTAEQVAQETQSGDVAYLAQARAVLADLRDLWGLRAPEKHAITNARGDDVTLDDMADVFRKAKAWTPEPETPAPAPEQPS